MLLYAWTLLLAFMVLTTHLYPTLSLTEIAFASVPVGTIGGAWIFFLITMLLNFLRCAIEKRTPNAALSPMFPARYIRLFHTNMFIYCIVPRTRVGRSG